MPCTRSYHRYLLVYTLEQGHIVGIYLCIPLNKVISKVFTCVHHWTRSHHRYLLVYTLEQGHIIGIYLCEVIKGKEIKTLLLEICFCYISASEHQISKFFCLSPSQGSVTLKIYIVIWNSVSHLRLPSITCLFVCLMLFYLIWKEITEYQRKRTQMILPMTMTISAWPWAG